MRFVFTGGGTLTALTVRLLVQRGHEVVIIERDAEVIDAQRDELDVGFIHGDGTRPAILREADPESTDMLFCLTHDDQSNIIGSLVAHSLGFSRVVTKIDDPELEHICAELGLADSLVPMHTVGRYLADLAEGQDIIELSDILRGDARIFSFTVSDTEARTIEALRLPQNARAICIYRNGSELDFVSPGTQLTPGNEVVVLTRAEGLKELRERFGSNERLDV